MLYLHYRRELTKVSIQRHPSAHLVSYTRDIGNLTVNKGLVRIANMP